MSFRVPLVILGPTASGKSGLAMSLAERFAKAEIISTDAMAVYKEMNIGTAKPSLDDRKKVKHHMVDMISVEEEFTISQFKAGASEALDKINNNNAVAIVVGGSGLYVSTIVDDLQIPPSFPDIRSELEKQEVANLWSELSIIDPDASEKIEPNNKRRIIRALEVYKGSGKKFSSFGPGLTAYPQTNFLLVGLEIDRSSLDSRIEERFDNQLEQGLVDEVKSMSTLNLSKTASQALGYRELISYLNHELTLEDAILEAKKKIKRFARRQQRWFKRDPRIKWFDALDSNLVDDVEQYWISKGDS